MREVKVPYENMLVIEVDEVLFKTSKPVYMTGVYIPPCESPAYRVTENGFGTEPLEQCLLDLQEKCWDFHFIICGDMNSIRGDKNGMLESSADGMYSDEA